jgi:hypothetical protein
MSSASELLQTAVTKTGLDDFGDDSFREGFEILVRALNEEGRLNARGEDFVFARVLLHLRQRLQVEDWYRRHPEIDEERIAAPVFGLGLPRTGSTALSFLLASASPGSRHPLPAQLGGCRALSTAVDRAGRRPAHSFRRRRVVGG